MVNTFWADEDPRQTMRFLDRVRLNKQVLETIQLINTIGDIYWLANHFQLTLDTVEDVTTIRKTYQQSGYYLIAPKLAGWGVQKRKLVRRERWQEDKQNTRTCKCGYWHHPATNMWLFHHEALALYFNYARRELKRRGTDHVYPYLPWKRTVIWPYWTQLSQVIQSHRASLVNKQPDHYQPLFGNLEWRGYWWPVDHR